MTNPRVTIARRETASFMRRCTWLIWGGIIVQSTAMLLLHWGGASMLAILIAGLALGTLTVCTMLKLGLERLDVGRGYLEITAHETEERLIRLADEFYQSRR